MRLDECLEQQCDDTRQAELQVQEGNQTETDCFTCIDNNSVNECNVFEDRIRVDRRKLEQMIQGDTADGKVKTADDFFQKIMDETDTQISWPSKLKIGAKSRKDPHIKICGRQPAVAGAREKILEVLDTKQRNRVTLKMDISHTDHSHIIGKGGNNIQKVMDETGCHIHFPDSNRNSLAEKSNQVSIAGQPGGAEKARCRVRELLPLVFSFQLPFSVMPSPPDTTSQALQLIQHNYGFTISVKTWPRGSYHVIIIRGCRKDFILIKQGLFILMDFLTGSIGTIFPVTLNIEIPPHNQSFVMGRNRINVQTIMQQTGALITFPDSTVGLSESTESLVTRVQRASTVIISGVIDAIYVAWQELMGYLPLVLMFDLKDGQELNTALIHQLMEYLKVNIIIRPKPRQNSKSVVVRGSEKDSRALFEVRRQLLGLDESAVPLCCDKHFLSRAHPILMSTLGLTGGTLNLQNQLRDISRVLSEKNKETAITGNIPSSPHFLMNNIENLQLPLNSSLLSTLIANQSQLLAANSVSNIYNQFPQNYIPNIYGNFFSTRMANLFNNPSYLPRDGLGINPYELLMTGIPDQAFCMSGSNSTCSTLSSPSLSPQPSPLNLLGSDWANVCSGGSNNNEEASIGWKNWTDIPEGPRPVLGYTASSGNKTQSTNHAEFGLNGEISCHPELGSRPTLCIHNDSNLGATGYSSEKDIGTVGCERKNIQDSFPFNYEERKLLATKAVQKPLSSEARKPTNIWSGFGFSKSLPETVIKQKWQTGLKKPSIPETVQEEKDVLSQMDSIWSYNTYGASNLDKSREAIRCGYGQDNDLSRHRNSLFSSSNCFDYYPCRPLLSALGNVSDVPQLLCRLGMLKYVDVFQQNEIDLATFLKLTSKDLQDLNIPPVPRQKILSAISALTKEKQMHKQYLEKEWNFKL
ncbi:protein bicaudal C homolog 1-B-like isoform X2 [Limulus polyphemus]|uniref:Protein bicaudal C homolog 1-B-like isoform X2 n=1 Tax=Limulus polyphemus TaxID=6850 RepID=A0ABM1C604_LIMPO|nr:protein bicaudal C homolog 1-B-like isoform X2 [Limulus polyphemus]